MGCKKIKSLLLFSNGEGQQVFSSPIVRRVVDIITVNSGGIFAIDLLFFNPLQQ
jgi:hypothetical protein